MDEIRIPSAGDPFYAAARAHDPHPDETEGCLCCYDGWVFIGHTIPFPDGDEEIVHEPVPCRRCAKK